VDGATESSETFPGDRAVFVGSASVGYELLWGTEKYRLNAAPTLLGTVFTKFVTEYGWHEHDRCGSPEKRLDFEKDN